MHGRHGAFEHLSDGGIGFQRAGAAGKGAE